MRSSQRRRVPKPWTLEETKVLKKGIKKYKNEYNIWTSIKTEFGQIGQPLENRTANDLRSRARQSSLNDVRDLWMIHPK
jgi:hypothetical protein